MKGLVYIFATVIVTISLIGIVNAKVVFEEYVTKAEVKQYLASASEYLESLTSLDRLTEIFDKNPTLRYEKDEFFRKRQEENEKAGRTD